MKTFLKAFSIASITAFGLVLGFSLGLSPTTQVQASVITPPVNDTCINGGCNGGGNCTTKKDCDSGGCGCGCTGKR